MKSKVTLNDAGSRGRTLLSLLLTVLILAAGAGTVLYYVLGPSAGNMTSDSTDSLCWAYEAYATGKAVNPDFRYAAILPFGANQIFLPFLAAFGWSMEAQIGGLCLFVCLFAAALFYFASGIGLSHPESAALTSLTMLLLSSSAKLREIMWEHVFYYNLGILFFCFGFGLVFRLLRTPRDARGKRLILPAIRLCVLLLFSALAALDGLQALICYSLPLCAALLAERLFNGESPLLSAGGKRSWLLLCTVGFGTLIGYLLIPRVTGGVTAAYQEAYSTFSAMSDWSGNLLGFFPNWFSLFGVDVRDGDALTSLSSLLNMLRILGALLLLAVPVILLCFWNRVKNRAVRLALVGHFTVSAAILFAVIFGSLGGANWRLTPMLGTSVILTAVCIFAFLRDPVVLRRIGVLLLALVILLSALPAAAILRMPPDYGKDNSWHVAADELEARGLSYGYANFWWAEAITLFSDGNVRVANIRENAAYPQEYRYQIRESAYDLPDGTSCFLLLTESENQKMAPWLSGKRASGEITDSFTVVSAPYNLRGYSGDTLYVYVFSENLF